MIKYFVFEEVLGEFPTEESVLANPHPVILPQLIPPLWIPNQGNWPEGTYQGRIWSGGIGRERILWTPFEKNVI